MANKIDELLDKAAGAIDGVIHDASIDKLPNEIKSGISHIEATTNPILGDVAKAVDNAIGGIKNMLDDKK